LTTGLSFDVRRSESTIFDGRPFPFSEGSDNGRSELRVLRGDTSWTRRMASSALTLRSIASFGLDALGATIQHGSTSSVLPSGQIVFEPGDPPDGVFFAWVGQLRYFYRFDSTGIEVDLRGDVQLSDRPLMSLEQFVVGGPGSVRGYRTNALAGDDGFSTGLEVRLPIVSTATGRNIVSILPFAEVGRIWNHARPDPQKPTLSSLGAGVEWSPHPKLSFRVDGAGALRDVGPKSDLQDYGVTFRVTWRPR
jgi:hemolysin activation/secretion protein